MVIVHVANIDTAVIGGVRFAVPKMVAAQSAYADVALVNTHGEAVDDILTLPYDGTWDLSGYPAPFHHPDLVVFHELYRFEYVGIYRHLLKAHIPYIIVPHGCFSREAQRKKWLKKAVANAVFFNDFIRHAHSIQYLSRHEQGLSAFSRCPAFVSGNGVTLPDVRKTVFSGDGVRFVYVGRMEMHIKGLDLLLDAVKRCEAQMRGCGATVSLYGPDYDGAHTCLQQRIDTLQIADLVHLEGAKMGEEKQQILLSAHCFIQTSRTEGLPLGPIEALAYGLPCIVTDGVGLGQTIEAYGAGYRCPTTVDGIATAMERFLHHVGEAEEMSRSAVQLVEQEFDMRQIAKNTVDRYRDIVG